MSIKNPKHDSMLLINKVYQMKNYILCTNWDNVAKTFGSGWVY